MRIQHNIMAMNAYRNYNINTSALSKNLEKLSSGYKINRAGDDAAGLAISEKMRAQITGLNAATKNVKDGISLVKTAEGAMQEIQDMLNRMDYLATQSANGTYQDEVDREALQDEVDALRTEINRIAESANFNGIKLLNGDLDSGGRTETIAGSTRIIPTAATANDDVTKVGEKTFLDGAEPTTASKTKFTMDFSDLKAKANAATTTNPNPPAGGGGNTFTAADAANLPNGMTNVAVADPDTVGVGDVKIKMENVATNSGATVAGADNLANLTFTDADNQGSIGNDINIKIVADSAGTEGATWDAASKTVTVTLDGTNGSGAAGAYNASDIESLIQAVGDKSGDSGIDFQNFTVSGTGEVDASTDGDVGAVALAGGEDAGKKITVTTAAGTSTQNIKTADWSGDVNISAGGVTATIDADGTTWDGTETVIGTIAADNTRAARAGGAGGDDIKVNVKLNGQAFAEDVVVTADATAADIAAAVFGALNDATDVEVDGVKYTVTQSGSKLTFEMNEDPTDTSKLGGNYTWDVGITGGKYEGSHTAGTNPLNPGSVDDPGVRANTVFEIKASDLTDGTVIELDGKKVTLAVGANSEASGDNLVTLTDAEASNLNLALGKIAQAFGGSTTNFEVSVNRGAGDVKTGLAIYKKANSQETYDTMEKLSGVFSIKQKGAVDDTKSLTLQIGDTSDSFNQMKVSVGDMHVEAMKIDKISVANQAGAQAAVSTIKDAINYVSSVRGKLGATQNRLEHTQNNLSVMAENIQDAESTIRDTDVAEEMMSYVKNNILVQSAQAMLAQANQVPQGVLQLLG